MLCADAISIDQTNIGKRSIQVDLMTHIYRSAKKVLIWLGEEDEHTEIAFVTIMKLSAWAAFQDKSIMAELVAEHENFTRLDQCSK